LMDPQNKKLFQEGAGEVLVSPLILNRFVARVALRRDLRLVFNEIFAAGGIEIDFRHSEWYGIGRENISFREIEKTVAMMGDLALGVKACGASGATMKRIHLNPARDSAWNLQDNAEIIVLTTTA
ncbi:MAG: ion channel DMI1, partial [Deltaproteobacteria bacterium]|nr:ion channel DMI1 [Deltaproteobacteria bacterium]